MTFRSRRTLRIVIVAFVLIGALLIGLLSPTLFVSADTFPTTGVLDNFNRDANPLDGWTVDPFGEGLGAFKTTSSIVAIAVDAGGDAEAYYSAATYGPDTEVYLKISSLPDNGSFAYVSLGISGGSPDGYTLEYARLSGTDTLALWKRNGGNWAQVGSNISQNFSSGDSMGLRRIGSNFEAFYKSGAGAWVSKGTFSDSTYTSAGRIGMRVDGASPGAFLDDFGGGTYVAATATPTPSDTPTITLTPSNTPTITLTPSNTPTITDTPTNTPTPSDTPTITPTITDTPTNTPTPSDTPTITQTPTDTPTITNTPIDTPTPSDTPTITLTPSDTPTPTDTPTPSDTPTITQTPTDTSTPTITPTPTITRTPAACPTDDSFSWTIITSADNQCARIVRQVTFGELYITTALLMLFALGAFYFTWKVITRWT